jgi:hypothetical protein
MRSRSVTPLILNLCCRSGKRPVSHRGISISEESGHSKYWIGGLVDPRVSLITWQVNRMTLTSCSVFSSWNASYSRFELHVQTETSQTDSNQNSFSSSGDQKNRGKQTWPRYRGCLSQTLRTYGVTQTVGAFSPGHKSQYLWQVRYLCEDVNTPKKENI